MAEVFIRHMVAKTRARGAEGLVFAQTRALWAAPAHAPRVRDGDWLRGAIIITPVFMYIKYTFNTP